MDLAELDAKATHFNLAIGAPDVDQFAVGVDPREIPAAVTAQPVLVDAEPLPRLAFQVAVADAGTANQQFTDGSSGNIHALIIGKPQAQVGYGDADRRTGWSVKVFAPNRSVAHVDRGFRDAVHVGELGMMVAEGFDPGAHGAHLQHFATEHNMPKRRRYPWFAGQHGGCSL